MQSGYYPVQAATNKGHAVLNLFSTTDEDYHAKLRRCVNHAFSMSTLLSYEPLVSSSTVFFLQQTLERFVKPGESVDFAHWLQYYAFDVIGELAWSKRLGFVEKNKDIDGIIAQVDWTLDYGVVVSCTVRSSYSTHCKLTFPLGWPGTLDRQTLSEESYFALVSEIGSLQ